MVYRILVLFAHPAFHRSRINRRLIASIRDLENVTINDLYEEYPDFYINVKREQQLLIEHDIIIFQHPFYWYSSPAILKQWEDLVLEFGFAYGPGGTKLQEKLVLSAITAGGPLSAYQRDGYNYFYSPRAAHSIRTDRSVLWDDLSAALHCFRGAPGERRGRNFGV